MALEGIGLAIGRTFGLMLSVIAIMAPLSCLGLWKLWEIGAWVFGHVSLTVHH